MQYGSIVAYAPAPLIESEMKALTATMSLVVMHSHGNRTAAFTLPDYN